MKIAGGIITNRGGRVCHAAIVARELGIPAVVGTGYGTAALAGILEEVTVSCCEGDVGSVYRGKIPHTIEVRAPPYSDAQVANRTIRVWHGATENGP
jgi:pyruvate,water dikinase